MFILSDFHCYLLLINQEGALAVIFKFENTFERCLLVASHTASILYVPCTCAVQQAMLT